MKGGRGRMERVKRKRVEVLEDWVKAIKYEIVKREGKVKRR